MMVRMESRIHMINMERDVMKKDDQDGERRSYGRLIKMEWGVII